MKPVQLVMIPGFLGRASDFSELRSTLPATIECHCLELPRIAIDPLTDSFHNIVQHWFRQQADRLPDRFVLLGYSLGARLAMSLCQHLMLVSPQRLQGLILESGNFGAQSLAERHQRWIHDQAWAQRFATEPMSQVLSDWYAQNVFASLQADQIKRLITAKQSLDGTLVARQLLALSVARQPDFSAAMQQLRLPFFFLSGKNDAKYTRLGQTLGAARHRVANHCGHNIHFEDPQWFAATLTHLIDSMNTH
ncbi:alpha/beta fold hydrolase [Gynuella sp.]|uniref:alpha/beta fold hydrolase n=1 Tax=Gynuella sp. TaxID=2969146 RepID=UPI003D116EA8